MSYILRNLLINEMAEAGYEVHFDEKWRDLHPYSIERAMWRGVAAKMLEVFLSSNQGDNPAPPSAYCKEPNCEGH